MKIVKVVKSVKVMRTLNGVKHNNRKKLTYYSQWSSNINLFFIFKNLIFKNDDLIKNTDITPD